MLTDRDERALLLATEERISAPLRLRAALAAVRALLRPTRRGAGGESQACQTPPPPRPFRLAPALRPAPRPAPRPSAHRSSTPQAR
ncbi:hypothetical protein ACFWAR_30100 [Streptomyces sp. NPDC059917]|uniref:hypothetical protein n=1 Tax=Streptomyces sp. NPDC059917 TaxID=3347002 RepID=UPI003663462D